MRRIDPNYLHDEKYIPYQELTHVEREAMLARYHELYSYYAKKAEVIDSRGFCPMDILHEIILADSKQIAKSIERTMKTLAIRECQKQSEYVQNIQISEEQPEFDVMEYIQKHENELSQIFKIKS